MLKVLFIMPIYSLPVDHSLGGGVELLKNSLIQENEKNKQYEFIFISSSAVQKTYELTKVITIKKYSFFDKFKRLVCYPLRKMKIIKGYAGSYYGNAYKLAKEINPDKIIFLNSFPVNINKYTKSFGREKIYLHLHLHCLDINKTDISKFCGNLISISQFIEDDWKNSNKLTLPINYYILRNCYSSKNFDKTKIENFDKLSFKKQLGYNKDDFIVVYCGRVYENKGIKKLIDSVLTIDNKKIKLLVLGGSGFKNSVNDKFVEGLLTIAKQNEDRIKFSGYVDNDELFKYYLISDVHVIPTLCEEAAGIVALESRVLGIPQIISNSGGLPEYASKKAIVIKRDENFVKNLSKAIENVYNKNGKGQNAESVYDEQYYYEEFKKIMGSK